MMSGWYHPNWYGGTARSPATPQSKPQPADVAQQAAIRAEAEAHSLGLDLAQEVDGVEPLQCAYWNPPDGDILLDGYFSLDELQAIVKYVEEHS